MSTALPADAAPHPQRGKSFDYAYSDDKGIKESFLAFSLKVYGLDKQLGKFANTSLRLGRVAGLLQAIKSCREKLKRTREIFFHNATALVPDLFEQARKGYEQFYIPPQYFNEHLPLFEELPTVLEELAASFHLLHVRIDEFREFTDEGLHLKSLLLTLDHDLKYRASCTRFYSSTHILLIRRNVLNTILGRLNTLLIQRYIHQFINELQVSLEKVTVAVGEFTDVGVSAISHEQERSSSNLTNILTVSTFFSGVTASTLQMSVTLPIQNDAIRSASFIWFISLIFSVGAALNSLLAMAWKATRSGSRGQKLPFWVTMWIHGSQLLFLGISIVTFSAGLIVFVFASSQASYAPYPTIASTAVTFIGLVAILIWMSYEMLVSPVFKQQAHVIKSGGDSVHTEISRTAFVPGGIASAITYALPFLRFPRQDDSFQDDLEQVEGNYDEPKIQEPNSKAKLQSGVKRVGIIHSALHVFSAAGQNQKRRSIYDGQRQSNSKRPIAGGPGTAPPTELTLSNEPISMIEFARYGTICDVAYSDDGKFLAITCAKKHVMQSWTGILDAETLTIIMDAWHEGRVISEHLKWSPSGKKIIVKFEHRFDVWRLDAKILRPIERNHTVQDVAWLGEDAFLVAEHNCVFKMNMTRQMAVYRFDHTHIRSIGLDRENNYLVLITRVAKSPQQSEPASGRSEKRIVVYDMDKEEQTYQVPVLENISSIYLIPDGLDMLITHKDQKAFQLWSLDAGIKGSEITAKLKKRPITPHDDPGDYIGPTRIGGNLNQFVLSVTTSGSIDVWRRESGMPYQRFQPSILKEEGVYCLSWRPSNDDTATFATAGIDSHTLLVWRGEERQLPETPALSPESWTSRSRWQLAGRTASSLAGSFTRREMGPLEEYITESKLHDEPSDKS